MQTITRYFGVLWRAEAIIATTRLRVIFRNCALYGLAAVAALFGLGMLNVAAFVALAPHWGSMWAALAAALGNFGLALTIVGIPLATRPKSDLNAALELRQAAVEGLVAEFGPLQKRITWLSGVARDPTDAALTGLLVPVITAIIRALRKKEETPPQNPGSG